MTTRRVLMISYYFPPQGGIGSLRAVRFATRLPERGWETLVLAPRSGPYPRDPSLAFPESRIIRTAAIDLSRAGKAALGLDTEGPAALRRGSVLDSLRRLVRRWLYRPDGQIGWYPFAVAAGRRAIRRERIDAIFSSSYPLTAHLVARRLHRDTGLPWVAEFRDLGSDWGSEGPRRQRLDEATERSILAAATEVVTVSPTYAEVLRSRGACRVAIITNGFDPEEFSGAAAPAGLVAGYLGTYYADRQDLGTALRALAALARDGHVEGLRLCFVGARPSGLEDVLGETGLARVLESTGFLTHGESLRHLTQSSLLLLAGPVSCGTPALKGHLPAKAFEYLGSRRPILFVGDPSSDVAEILRPFPHVRIVPPGDVEGAKASILALLGAEEAPSDALLEPFMTATLTARLAAVLDQACG